MTEPNPSSRPPPGRPQEIVRAATVPTTVSHYRAYVFQGYVVAAIFAFAVLAVLAHTTAYFPFDLTVTRGIQEFNAPWFSILMQDISAIGREPQVMVIVNTFVVLLFLAGLRWEAVSSLFAWLGAFLLGGVVKLLVSRPRPDTEIIKVFTSSTGDSFPSGHVLLYTAFFGFLWFLAYILLKHSAARTMLLFLLGSLVILVGPSRIYLGEHWTSDVLAAYLLGSLWLALSIYLYRWGKPRFFVRQPVAPEQPLPKHPVS